MNRINLFACIVVWLLVADQSAHADDALSGVDDQLMEEVVAVGRRPGPPLWRVEQGDHTLWIFGTLKPLPKSLEWDTESVEWIVSQSQAYITPPYISASTSNPFKAFGALRELRRIEKLPDGATLADVLPADSYDAFEQARIRYAPRNRKLNRLRPMIAAQKLFEQAQRSVGLTDQTGIDKSLRKLARKHDVPLIETDSTVEIGKALDVFRDVTMDAEINCLNTTVESIHSDLNGVLQRAMAWAEGDASLLKRFDYPDIDTRCSRDTYQNADAMQAREIARSGWLNAATEALNNNSSTFASLPVRELIHPLGLLAQLRARGFRGARAIALRPPLV